MSRAALIVFSDCERLFLLYTWPLHAFSLIGYLSDFLKTFPFTLGHKCLCKISSSILTPYANLTEITSVKAIDMRCI